MPGQKPLQNAVPIGGGGTGGSRNNNPNV